jgi:hypothetical protein
MRYVENSDSGNLLKYLELDGLLYLGIDIV